MRPSRSGLSLVFALCANIPLAGQNLESIGKEKPISLTGGISFNQIFYSASGIESRRDPYSYFASGNVNLTVYGWAVPLSFNISNQNSSFSQPFNQYSLHPTYKSVTTHVGYTSMSFSPYTVNGHTFLGAGIDILPEGNWKFSALYGRFLKAVQADSLNDSSQPSFERMGYGIKSTYGNGRNSIDLILFHAYDDLNSLINIPDSLDVTPQENLVISLGIRKTLFKNFLLKTELSTSAITKDTRAEKADNAHLIARSGILFESRLSSSFYNAFKTSFDYQHGSYIIGLAYEKIDPQYRTLGAYYFNNDLENITVNGSAGILQGKLNIAGSAGTQRDNLDKSKISTMRRLVGSLNLQYTHSQRLNFSASYSSFQTYTNIRSQFVDINQLTPYDQLDTLNFTQISKNASATAMYTFPGEENRKQNINIHVTFQDASEEQGKLEQNSGTRFYNINTAYSITLPPKNLSISLTFNGALNQGSFIETKVFGPNASITRSFMNRKLRTSLSSSFNKTYTNGIRINTAINCRANAILSIGKKHNVNLSAVMVKRNNEREGSHKTFTEFTATLGYSYAFGTK